MKTAICLYGTTGYSHSLANNLSLRKPLDVVEPLTSLLENIVSINKSDIFVHSWSIDKEEEVNRILKPKDKLFQNFKTFDKNPWINSVKSRFYSQYNSNNLMRFYANENNIKYDFVMHVRLDLIWFSKFNFFELNPQKFYVSNWNISEKRDSLEHDVSNDNNNLGPFDKSNYGAGVGLMDHWFLSNYNNMNLFSNLYENLKFIELINWINNFKSNRTLKNKNFYNPLHLTYIYAKRLKIEIEYVKYRGYDYDLYRRYKNPNYFK